MADESAIKTYRYLRIGMVGVVFLLATSIWIEHFAFGALLADVDQRLLLHARAGDLRRRPAHGDRLLPDRDQGQHAAWEDTCLNVAGMLAPVVAVAPTSDVAQCWSVQPIPLPLNQPDVLAAGGSWTTSTTTSRRCWWRASPACSWRR